MGYEVRIAPAAEKAISKLSKSMQVSVLDKMQELGAVPRPAGCEKVRGLAHHEVFRARATENYRIIYQVRDAVAVVLVVRVADRKEVYRRIEDLKRLLG